jgi:hypothetical protein
VDKQIPVGTVRPAEMDEKMIDTNVTSIQHEAKAEDIFDNLLDQIDAPPEFLEAIDDVVIGEIK